jgi:hypothetical protein
MKKAMLNSVIGALALSLGVAGAAAAQSCSSPSPWYHFSDNSTAYAYQVENNFSGLLNCVGTLAPAASPNLSGTVGVTGVVRIANGSSLQFSDTSGHTPFFILQTDNNFVFYNTDSAGGVHPSFSQQMGSSNPTFTFYTPVYTPSDLRLKTNVATLSSGLALIAQLRPVRYNWIPANQRAVGQSLNLAATAGQIGFVAQELVNVVPEAVKAPANSTDIYSIRMEVLIPILVRSIQEQQAEIQQLQAQVAALKPTTP